MQRGPSIGRNAKPRENKARIPKGVAEIGKAAKGRLQSEGSEAKCVKAKKDLEHFERVFIFKFGVSPAF